MILPREFLSDGTLHQSGQRRQDVDRGVDLPVVELTVDEDLSLGLIDRKVVLSAGVKEYIPSPANTYNVSGQIGNGMGDV